MKIKDGDASRVFAVLFVSGYAIIGGMFLVGCSTAGQVKKQVASDLTNMVQKQDCAHGCIAGCEALKEAVSNYIHSKLGE